MTSQPLISMKENRDYSILTIPQDAKHIGVRILTGPYEGLMYAYGTVTVEEDEDGEGATLNYSYKIIEENDELSSTVDLIEFQQYTDAILNDIINTAFEEKNYELYNEHGHKIRDTDSPSSDQR